MKCREAGCRCTGTEVGLKIHSGRQHKSAPQPEESRPTPIPVGIEDGRPVHEFAAKRNQAVAFADLPWVKFPSDVVTCDEALDAIAFAVEQADRALPFWVSLRAYITALRKRLDQKAAA